MKATILSRVKKGGVQGMGKEIPDTPGKANRTVDEMVQDDWKYNAAQ
jgi:hypothetical protein